MKTGPADGVWGMGWKQGKPTEGLGGVAGMGPAAVSARLWGSLHLPTPLAAPGPNQQSCSAELCVCGSTSAQAFQHASAPCLEHPRRLAPTGLATALEA